MTQEHLEEQNRLPFQCSNCGKKLYGEQKILYLHKPSNKSYKNLYKIYETHSNGKVLYFCDNECLTSYKI